MLADKCDKYAPEGRCVGIETSEPMRCIYSAEGGNEQIDLENKLLPVPYPGGDASKCYFRQLLRKVEKNPKKTRLTKPEEIVNTFLDQGYVYAGQICRTHLINNSYGLRIASITRYSVFTRSGARLKKNSKLAKALNDIGAIVSSC